MTLTVGEPQPVPFSKGTRFGLAIPVMLLAVFAAQCIWFISTQSITVDEPFHIQSGQDGWRHSQFKERDDNPPLARLWMSVLVRGEEFRIVKRSGYPVDGIYPSAEALTWRARMMVVLLGVGLGVLLWRTACRLYSRGAANLVLALFALSPVMITHFSLATIDGPATLALFAATVQLGRWRANPSLAQTAMLGIVLGAMLATKLSLAPSFALALLLTLMLGRDGLRLWPSAWNWKQAWAAVGVAFLVLWACYFFNVTRVTVHDGQLTATFHNFEWPLQRQIPTKLNFTVYIPAAEFLTGLYNVGEYTRQGVVSYLFGETYIGGKLQYFPVVVALKWPTIILLLAGGGSVLLLLRKVRAPGVGLILIFPAVFFAMALVSKLNLGDRHILVVYPYLLLLAGAVWEGLRRRRAWAVVLIVLVALQAADTMRYAPDYLCYFNPFVDPAKSYELLSDANLDWGQGLLALRRYEAEHPNETLNLAYFGNVVPQSVYGIRARPVVYPERPAGTVVVSAWFLSIVSERHHSNYQWIKRYPRKGVIGHVLHIFEVPPDGGNPQPSR